MWHLRRVWRAFWRARRIHPDEGVRFWWAKAKHWAKTDPDRWPHEGGG